MRRVVLLLALLLTGCAGAPAGPAASSGSEAPAPAPAVSEELPEPEPAVSAEAEPDGELAGMTICLDPGHGITDRSERERVSPKSEETKPAYVSGASGSRITEEALNLQVAFRLRDRLTAMGAQVLLTRETNAAAVSNIERAQLANQAGADVCIRIHADGMENREVHGVSVLVPAGPLLGTPSIAQPSAALGQSMVDAVAAQTGTKNRGIVEREDLTGFNWSEVPCVLLEMGFVTNADEEANLIDPAYQDKIVDGVAQAVAQWRAAQTVTLEDARD